MFLKRLSFKSNATRHSLLGKVFMDNKNFFNKIKSFNKKFNFFKKKKLNGFKNIIGPCFIKSTPIVKYSLGGVKTNSFCSYPRGIFFNSNFIFLSTLLKGSVFLKKTKTNHYMYPIKAHNHRSRLGEYMFSVFLKFGIKVSMVYLNNYSTAYTASSGNYLVFLGFFKKKNLSLFRLPSSRKTFFPSLSICLVGRHVGLFMKYRVFGSFKFYNLKKKKRFSTRGVAMNPVDHHNGGRSKTKSPFFNKYNNLAKKNK